MFTNAKEIWIEKTGGEYNRFAGFSVALDYAGGKVILKAAAADYYKLYLNGSFFCYGPARTAKGFFRVDEIDISARLKKGSNRLFILAVSYNVNCFMQPLNKGFLSAEVFIDGKSVLWTGKHFAGHTVPQHLQKVQRYSYQRSFSEVLNIDASYQTLLAGLSASDTAVVSKEKEKYLPRGTRYCEYRHIAGRIVKHGEMKEHDTPQRQIKLNPPFLTPTEKYMCYKTEELHFNAADFLSRLTTLSNNECSVQNHDISQAQFMTYDMGVNGSGFISLDVNAVSDSEIYLLFDEMLLDGDIDPLRLSCLNMVCFRLKKGSHIVETFEPYTFKFIKVFCKTGQVSVKKLELIEVCNPDAKADFNDAPPALKNVLNAAVNTFKYSSVDIFMDCPSRERAGWLCDSYFLGFAEHAITGQNRIEHDFLQNFVLSNSFDHLPNGMLPMCYPSEHTDGGFIPNWAMWFVLELEQYLLRTKDEAMRAAAQGNVMNLLEYFKKYENEHGLLEKLDGWIFIEWSRAAEFTQDVNFPTNMLYSSMLETVGRLYNQPELTAKAAALKAKIREQSFDGAFFADNAVRKDGKMETTQNISEVCQYYAFFCGVADPVRDAGLLERLISDFGPDKTHPVIYKANAFIGNFLRLDILRRLRPELCLKELTGYFEKMARLTGTLWENDSTVASLCHGFASYVVFIYKDIMKI